MYELDYENQLLLDALNDNSLFIFCKGIATEKVLTNLFRSYATDGNLVFVLSASSSEEAYFKDKLPEEKITSITTEFNANDRKDLYARGGVFFITTRILIVDFLKDVVPAEKITGMIVLRAHNVIESSQESFILRLYRTKNKDGFIKAFSHSPTSFLCGYSQLNRVMRSTFLANVSLWPRFHAAVKESLSKAVQSDGTDSVIEIQLNMNDQMREIQSNLLDLVSWSVSELKRFVPALNDEEINVETALTKKFEKIVSAYMDPVWNTISSKAKDIMNELKIFRLLLAQLTKCDCVSFYSTLCNYTSHEAAFKSSWVISKSAENIITAARNRVLPTKTSTSKQQENKESKKSKSVFKPEVHPKWLALSEILNEICIKKEKQDEENTKKDEFAAKLKTMIFAEDVKTCSILRDYLAHGSDFTLAKVARNCDNLKIELPAELIMTLNSVYYKNKAEKGQVGIGKKRPNEEASNSDDDDPNVTSRQKQITLTQIERKYEDIEFLQTPIFIRPLKQFGNVEAFGISESLEKIRPDVIILFDPNLELVRNIEVYRARFSDCHNVRVYFLSFHNSVEEQIYLTSIQREKLGFEKLIEEKGSMVVPTEREGKDELNQDLWRDPTKANETVSTSGQSRRNMQLNDDAKHVILVDMREFRSELPSLIHKRGIELEPLTLDVGDYILTPDICVERKSISDLVGSLNSGRLYKQAEAMGRHYKKPVLLIEHEQTQGAKLFRFRNDLAQIMPKLQLLTINFPKLRLIWSPSSYYTSEIFHELKRGKEQPSGEQALSIQKEQIGSYTISKYNLTSHSFLSKLPGVDSRNVYSLLNRCRDMNHLVSLSETELGEILENSNAASVLYAGLHNSITQENSSENASAKASTSKPALSRGRRGLLAKK